MIDYILLALAITRITRLLTTDVILEPLREFVWRRLGNPGVSKVGYLFTCNWCMSIYVASLTVAMYKIAPAPTVVVCAIFAYSMVAGTVLDRVG